MSMSGTAPTERSAACIPEDCSMDASESAGSAVTVSLGSALSLLNFKEIDFKNWDWELPRIEEPPACFRETYQLVSSAVDGA